MDNGCKTYQQATLEMLWLGTIKVDQLMSYMHWQIKRRGPGGPPRPQLRPECRKKFFWRVPPPPPPPHARHYIKVWIRH